MMLMKNSEGYAVQSMQEILQDLGVFTGTVNGIYDRKTQKAVALFQEKNGLDPTGLADDETLVLIAIKSAVVKDT